MKKLTVLLKCGTIGKVSIVGDCDDIIGTRVCVEFKDENGLPFFEIGLVEEVLEVNEY